MFRAVESSLTYADSIRNFKVVKDFLHNALCFVPLLGSTDVLISVLRIPLWESVRYIFIKTECFKHINSKLKTVSELVLKLFRQAHKMTFGNCELTNSDKSVHLAACFISEKCWSFIVTERKISVWTLTIKISLILERASHRTKCKYFIIFFRITEYKHTVHIVVPVTADFVKVALSHKRCFCK